MVTRPASWGLPGRALSSGALHSRTFDNVYYHKCHSVHVCRTGIRRPLANANSFRATTPEPDTCGECFVIGIAGSAAVRRYAAPGRRHGTVAAVATALTCQQVVLSVLDDKGSIYVIVRLPE